MNRPRDRLVTQRSRVPLSREFRDLMRRCAGTVVYLQSANVTAAELFASALHHSRPLEKVLGLRDLCGEAPAAVKALLGVRLELEKTMPTETKAQRDAILARAVELLSRSM